MASELEVGTATATTRVVSSGEVRAGNGTAGNAAFGFGSNTNTGMYRVGSNALGLTTGGTARLTIDSTGHIILPTAGKTIKTDLSSGGTTRTSVIELYNPSTAALSLKTDNASTGGIEFWTEGQKRLDVQRDGVCTFSGGIAFPAPDPASAGTPATSSVLDVYEEGTFTFTITGSSTAGTHSGILTQGNYTRVGNICTVMGYYYGTSGTGSGDMIIGGLPFPVKSGAAPVGTIQANSGFVVPSGSNPTVVSAGSSTFKVRCTKEDGSAFAYASYPTDPEYIRFGVTYVI